MNNYPVNVLDTQYRMHPDISAFPSLTFYSGNLKDGPGVAENTARAWHADKASILCDSYPAIACESALTEF